MAFCAVVAQIRGEEAVGDCAVDPWVRLGEKLKLARDFAPYRAPPWTGPVFGGGEDGSKATVVFVHMSKCAGTTMKHALADAARALRVKPPLTIYRKTWPKFAAACAAGKPDCERALYAGTNAFGACALIVAAAARKGEVRRCGYATVLRDPYARLVSSWRYFCGDGAEGRKGWMPEWRRGPDQRCRWSLDRWADLQPALTVLDLSTDQRPRATLANQTQHCPLLADGPSDERSPPDGERPRAHLAAALANAVGRDAPVRAIVVEDLRRGLAVLAAELGLPLDPASAGYKANANTRRPELGRNAAAVRAKLALDVALYDAVRADAAARADALGIR